MPQVAVDLHVHEEGASHDALTSAQGMHTAFTQTVEGTPAAVGYVGHDQIADQGAGVSGVSFTGVEHTISESSPEIHIVEYPDHNFSYLAHPRRVDSTNPKDRAKTLIEKYGLDGVEKYRTGVRQYDGTIPNVVELSNSDGHNTHAFPSSYMVVGVDSVGADSVFREIKAGRFETVSTGSVGLAHQIGKSFAMVSSGTWP